MALLPGVFLLPLFAITFLLVIPELLLLYATISVASASEAQWHKALLREITDDVIF
jgi:hypothetical protein